MKDHPYSENVVHPFNAMETKDGHYDIMISYASQSDFEFVKAVVRNLREQDYKVWRDEDILYHYPTDNHIPNIRKGIESSDVILYIHSKQAEENRFIQEEELRYAHAIGKKILVHLHNYEDTSFPQNPWLSTCPPDFVTFESLPKVTKSGNSSGSRFRSREFM